MKDTFTFSLKQSLFYSLIALLTISVRAQVVNISANPTSISTPLNGGDSTTTSITLSNSGNAPLYWQITGITVGDPVTFTRPDNALWNLPENQDRISGQVWLARRNTENIFNAALESSWNSSQSPLGTEWASG